MHGGLINSRPTFGELVQVQTAVDIEYLIKESEVLTGQRGREFVVYGGADRFAYRIHWYPNGYEVQRLDAAGNPTGTMPEMFDRHCLGNALCSGCLFTPVVPDQAPALGFWVARRRSIAPRAA